MAYLFSSARAFASVSLRYRYCNNINVQLEELHLALTRPVVAPHEGIEYLVRAGVPLNASDRWGKTPLAYWRESRDYEVHWFRVWLIERVTGDPDFRREREDRAKISAFLARSGASL